MNPRGAPGRLQLTSRAVSGLLVGALLGVMLAVALLSRMGDLGADPQEPSSGARTDRAREAIDRHHCSPSGFGDGTIPASALIRTGTGDLLLVSFDRGWQVHQDEESAAELVAVCLEDLPPGVTQKRP
ncbi:hypothetical protein [Nocardioides sp.]|uniref:hypothetical protein n=1 Tax=Nocardioides sp. TaxID=35761 RepID=UPI002606E382|nr:hypothetical protein [Nocardioides sp.]MDI6910491.1 hypothetical protein [Nocardioides sp.]